MQQSVGHGGKRDGAGRPKGALNLITRPVKELAAEQSEASINRLIQLRDHAESEQVQFAAAKELLDRAHGRPKQEVNLTDGGVTITVNRMPVALPVVDVASRRAPALIEDQSDEQSGAGVPR